MSWRSRHDDGRHFQNTGKSGISRNTFDKLSREDQSRMMSYGNAKGDEIKRMVRKYTESGSLEKGYRSHTLENVDMKDLRKIPTSFLYVVYDKNKANKNNPKLKAVEKELVRRHVFKPTESIQQLERKKTILAHHVKRYQDSDDPHDRRNYQNYYEQYLETIAEIEDLKR